VDRVSFSDSIGIAGIGNSFKSCEISSVYLSGSQDRRHSCNALKLFSEIRSRSIPDPVSTSALGVGCIFHPAMCSPITAPTFQPSPLRLVDP
jgi:hypothetical protein